MFSALKICQSSNVGAPYLWTAFTVGLFGQVFLRGGEACSQRPLLPTQTVIVQSLCLGLVANGCNLEGTGLALLIHSSWAPADNICHGLPLASYGGILTGAFCLDRLAWLKLEASKRVTCALTATLATVTRAGPLFVVLPARRPLPWWQAHTR